MGLDAGSLFGFFGGTKHNHFHHYVLLFCSFLSVREIVLTLRSFWGLFCLSFLLDACTWECWLVLSLFISQHLMIFHWVLNTYGTLSHFEIILQYTFPVVWTFSMCSSLIQQFSFSLLTTKHVPAFSDSYFKPTIVHNKYISRFTWD